MGQIRATGNQSEGQSLRPPLDCPTSTDHNLMFVTSKKHKRLNMNERCSFGLDKRHLPLDTLRPDMTFAVDWALKTNYLSIYH